ncbi:DNA repair protein RadA [Calditerrivibrio nitroreducens]|uniref:DNA repair protein RadA n=1 Tax=Calditerrivibrio nitroreducens (strain DSM 19672 / NBRC 101217 / Yu37-1) TaxID=768670 RepID=E4THX9_CALNY|nr:DNA repair protein RadA [Calditerrivibrio nitroreducens]ADR18909.1 DNA replication and repair protein RadA [Calditerrivibrio nitroreducens DSM 19672]
MPKIKSHFVCNQCGAISPKWVGKCPECGSWNSFTEEIIDKKEDKNQSTPKNISIKKLSSISGIEVDRFITGIKEFDQVLGGGLVKGSVILIGGEPGIGKSTIMLQISAILTNEKKKVIYFSGEESYSQIKIRADRLGIGNIELDIVSTNSFENIQEILKSNFYDYAIIDSIQTFYSEEISSAAGTVSQIKHITHNLVEIAKSIGTTIFIIGQVTKEGSIAGPKVLEHLVDTVLYFEGDYNRGIRILRSVKNRFGPTNEVGFFEMSDKGLKEISYKELLISSSNFSGRALTSIMEGTRFFLVEVESLVTPTFFNFSKRIANGFDLNRLNMIAAILEKRGGLNISNHDIYLSIAGGLKINEPAADLAISASLISAFKNTPLPESSIFIGEVSLTGEVRQVSNLKNRINEALKLNIKNIFAPGKLDEKDLNFYSINNILDLIKYL